MDLSESKDTWNRLAARFQQNWPGSSDAVVTEFSRLSAGHSNDTYSVVFEWREAGKKENRSFVLRTSPEGVGLLEPYDIGKQFRVMKALRGSKVPVPEVYWLDEDSAVIGKPYFVMERLEGDIVESGLPAYLLNAEPAKIRRICQHYVETIAAIHGVDRHAPGLAFLGDGTAMLDREIAWWESEIRRFQQGPLPSFDAIIKWLKANKPEQTPAITLVHGDAKTGNMFLNDETVIAMFDWEMASVGDPMTDVGWFTCQWDPWGGSSLPTMPGALTKQEVLDYYEKLSGIKVHDLKFYEALAMFKMAAIVFVGAMLYDTGKSSDLRYLAFGPMVKILLERELDTIGVSEAIPHGKIMSGWDRIIAGTSDTIANVIMPELQSQVARSQAVGLKTLLWFFSTGATPPAAVATAAEQQTQKDAPH